MPRSNCTVTTSGLIAVAGTHSLTKESQEVMEFRSQLLPMTIPSLSLRLILCTDILHSGQLNIATSTLDIGVVMSILIEGIGLCNVSS